jgi:hypothetical protein
MSLPYAISLEEALDRLSDDDPMELWFECRPNTGVTHCIDVAHDEVVQMLKNSPDGTIAESGWSAQKKDLGIYVPFEARLLGWGLLFIRTKPEKRISKKELMAHEVEFNEGREP